MRDAADTVKPQQNGSQNIRQPSAEEAFSQLGFTESLAEGALPVK